jgi:hypothetical protein
MDTMVKTWVMKLRSSWGKVINPFISIYRAYDIHQYPMPDDVGMTMPHTQTMF